MKKSTILLLSSLLVLGVSGCSNTKEDTSTGITITKTESQESGVSNKEISLDEAIQIVQDAGYEVRFPAQDPVQRELTEEDVTYDEDNLEFEFKASMDTAVLFYKDMAGDDTGHNRVAIINTEKDLLKYIPEYYYAYFKSDAEFHYVVNNGLGVVYTLEKAGDEIFVTIREFDVSWGYNEEDFTKGEYLGTFRFNLESGKIQELNKGEWEDYNW